MDNFLVFLLLGVGLLSFIPVIAMNRNTGNRKYRCLQYLINVAFLWTLLMFVERLSMNVTIIYFSHILGFPIKFLLAALMICTIFNYVEKAMPSLVNYFFGIVFFVELVLVFTNSSNQFLLEATPSSIFSFSDLYSADNGPLFIYHLIIIYLVLIIGILYLFLFLSKHRSVRQYKAITRTMAFSIVIVLAFNMIQLFLIETTVDLTYISLVFVSFALYNTIFRKDMIFNLKASGRGEILSNMREMYILTDSERNVVEISNLLIDKYKINSLEFEGKPLSILITKLEESIVFYSEYQVDTDMNVGKDHFHLREKKFHLKGMNDYGYMILLYDETQVFNLLRDLNRLSNFDIMTGLNNRNYIENIVFSLDKSSNIGVLSLDLNGLKANNDYLGHERGDLLLKSLADKMKLVMNDYPGSELARVGGDEFLILLENTNEKTLDIIKTRILEECESEDLEKKVSVSIGTAFSEEKADIYLLIRKADESMYAMKRETSNEYAKSIVEYAKNRDMYIR